MNNLHKQKVISKIHNSTYFLKRHLLALVNLYWPISSMVSCLHQPIWHSRSINTIGTKNAHSTSNNFRNSPIRPLCIHLLVFGLVRDPISQSKVGVHVIHHTKILEFFGCSSTFIRVYATIHAFVEGFRARSHLFSKFSQFFCCNATIFYVWEIIR